MELHDGEMLIDTREDLQAQGHGEPIWSRRRPEPPKRLRMDWGKLGKALLFTGSIIGAWFAMGLPLILGSSGILILEVVGYVLGVTYILAAVAIVSGALEIK